MNEKTVSDLPKNTCAYEMYDPSTLKPLNSESAVRLQELGWQAGDFSGRTVLDIGCNSGLLTLHALSLGATQVHACDVQPSLVSFFSDVVARKALPVTVTSTAFDKLTVREHKADVVLFMEVLHWAVSQGIPIRNCIAKLAALTGRILYIEFPWSVREPSIVAQTKLTEETYSADVVLDELTRYFRTVRVVRFMRYFGYSSPSQRVLVEARDRRSEAELLSLLPGIYSLDYPMTRGRNESFLLSGPNGPLVAKSLAKESGLRKLPKDILTKLFDELSASGPKAIVLPRKIDGKYLIKDGTGKDWIVSLLAGAMPGVRRDAPVATDAESLIELFALVRHDLSAVSLDTVNALKRANLVQLPAAKLQAIDWANDPDLGGVAQPLAKWLAQVGPVQIGDLDALAHGDLQLGNFVPTVAGPKVVDLDNMVVGTVYSDGLLGFIWRGAPVSVLSAFSARLESDGARPLESRDINVAIRNGLGWLTAIRAAPPTEAIAKQVALFVSGLESCLLLAVVKT